MSEQTTKKYPRGSEWRKWDLHLHPPGTKKNDQYKVKSGDALEIFCDKIEESDVSAFGITDYFSADGYLDFIKKFREKYPQSQKIVFPNIELATNDVVNKAKEEVNLHIIFNPELPDLEKKLKKFIEFLSTSKTKDSKKIKASELSTTEDYEGATTTRAFISDALKEILGEEVDITESVLILVAANNDGVRTERGKKRKIVITDEVDKFCHGFFGNSGNTEHFLKTDRLDDGEDIIGKPVVTGSDSHSFDDLEQWLGKLVKNDSLLKEPTWIKADLTFEGLRQILFEPQSRVFIGLEPDIEIRTRNNQTKYIESLYIDQNKGYDENCGIWFKGQKIPLNKELVAIIGNKGSGKSALTDIIGLLGNSHNQKYDHGSGEEELFSFLNKKKFLKKGCASNFNGSLNWYSGDPETAVLDSETDSSIPEKVEYLPQKYLEKICANIEDDEFRKKLNEVIFGYVHDKDRHGRQRLEDLIAYLTNQAEQDINVLKDKLHDKNGEIISWEQRLTLDYTKEIADKIESKKEELGAHEKNKPDEVPEPKKKSQENKDDERSSGRIESIDKEILLKTSSVNQLKNELTKLTSDIEELGQAKKAIERAEQGLKDINKKYQSLFTSNGLSFEDVVKFSTDFGKITGVVEKKQARINEINQSLREPADIDGDQKLNEEEKEEAKEKSLPCVLERLAEEKKELVDALGKPEKDYQDYLKKKAAWDKTEQDLRGEENNPAEGTLNWLNKESANIKSVYPKNLEGVRQERIALAKQIFDKKKEYIDFYNSVKGAIDEEIEKYDEELGEYKIKIDAGMKFDESFYENFFQFISQGVKGSFYGSEGNKKIQEIIENVNDWENKEEIFSVLKQIVEHIDKDKRASASEEEKNKSVFTQLKRGKDPVAFYDYLFGLDYIETKYDLKVDDKDLSELSPGERGGLLLIFYLMLDRRDIPLVIDQPEDNLDNESVYQILVTFLKKAKERRQIIMVTHNPNLAVVADAEQIIHVSIDKKNKTNKFHYSSGSIENPDINRKVVDVLEGTYPAFDNRRLKYRKEKKTIAAAVSG